MFTFSCEYCIIKLDNKGGVKVMSELNICEGNIIVIENKNKIFEAFQVQEGNVIRLIGESTDCDNLVQSIKNGIRKVLDE